MEKIKNKLTQKILINLTYALITILYFVFFSTQSGNLEELELIKYIKASSIFFLCISIIMLEIGYRKNSTSTFFNGIEFLAIAIFILLTEHMTKLFSYSIQAYTLAGANFFSMYYILKSALIYTKEQQNKLNNLSDIKEIVKEESIKKETKRKNKKAIEK